jgi:hypothetical protein
MEGCGTHVDYVLYCQGYCGWASITELEKRAAFELGCDHEALKTQELSEGTYGVQGCGQRASYVLRHTGWGKMEWILNSNSVPVATPGAGGPPPG